VDYLPSPVDVPAIKGVDEDGNEVARLPNDKEPLALLAFKIMDDPLRWHHHLLPHLFRHAGYRAPASSIRRATARSGSAACC